MIDQKLKPCPFCGEEMEVEKVGRSWYRLNSDLHGVDCVFVGMSHSEWSQTDVNLKVLVSEWNYRPEEIRLADEVAKLKRCVLIQSNKGGQGRQY